MIFLFNLDDFIFQPNLGRLGTFGYAREMAGVVELRKLGGILPKTITRDPRPGNAPWRTVEISAGLLNAIGLDNDGIDYFLAHHWPYLRSLGASIIVSIAGKSHDDFVYLANRMNEADGLAALELNISCARTWRVASILEPIQPFATKS